MKAETKIIKGKCNEAIIYTQDVDSTALDQIKQMCNYEPLKGSKIRIMCDVHAGAGCTIGTTMTITDRVVPAMVGVDIGCGMRTVQLCTQEIDYRALDEFIRRNIPAGRGLRDEGHPYSKLIDLEELRCYKRLKLGRALKSVGTLGGGNHFIEIDRADNGTLFLVVHSGSRNLGVEVASYYQRAAYDRLRGADGKARQALIDRLKVEGRDAEIQEELVRLRSSAINVPLELAYVEGDLMQDYLHDMRITQRFAMLNRKAIADEIVKGLGLGIEDVFETVHNYIDVDNMILRKGAVSAQKGERLLIPLNMRDGALICVGKGNPDWNYSAPHGAGRKLSRATAKSTLSMQEYEHAMQGIYTTSVNRSTLDESPMAYKSMYEIRQNIRPTVSVEQRILPTYNFKAGE